MSMRSFALVSCVALLGGLGAASAHAQALPEAQLVQALQKGGYVIAMRHASAPAEPPKAPDIDPANTGGERQLDPAGRAASVEMGRAIKSLHIPVGEVWSSPTFRARQTIALAQLPKPTTAPELGDAGRSMSVAGGAQAAWLKAKVAEPPNAGTDRVIVTHLPNLTAAFGQQAAGLPDGAALVFRPVAGGQPELVGRIRIEDWPRLAGGR